MRLADPHAAAQVAGLDEDRILQLRLDLGLDRLRIRVPGATGEDSRCGHRNPVGVQDPFLDRLVHSHRGSRDAAAHVGHFGQVQQTLDRPVLAVGAVQHRKHHVQRGVQRARGAIRHARRQAHRRLRGLGIRFDGAFQERHGIVVQQPFAGLGDADRPHVVLLRVQRLQNEARGAKRDFVLAGAAAEEHADPELAFSPHVATPRLVLVNSASKRKPASAMASAAPSSRSTTTRTSRTFAPLSPKAWAESMA